MRPDRGDTALGEGDQGTLGGGDEVRGVTVVE